jgi:hypothetical protein
VELSREADVQGWLQPHHSDLPEQYTTYIGFEAEARSVRNESLFIPGPLQTEDYARAVIIGNLPMASEQDVEARVRVRMERQAVLTKDNPQRLRAVVDEAALHRQVGGARIMHEQLTALLALSRSRSAVARLASAARRSLARAWARASMSLKKADVRGVAVLRVRSEAAWAMSMASSW